MLNGLNRAKSRTGIAAVVAITALGVQAVSAASKPRGVLPPGGGYYGGGKVSARAAAQNALVLVHVANNRRSIHIGVQLWTTCTGPGVSPAGNGFTGSDPAIGVLHRDGTFSGKLHYGTQGTAGAFNNTFTFSGRFISAERAVGTVEIEGVDTANSSIRCGSGRVRFEIDDPTLSRGSGAFRRGTAYYGANDTGPTTQGVTTSPFGPQPVWPMNLVTASRGRRVTLVAYTFASMKCAATGQHIVDSDLGPPATVTRSGSFTETDSWDRPLAAGVVGHFTSRVTGRFGGRRVHGSLRVDGTVASSSTGQVIDHCTTGDRRWAAVRAGTA